MKVETKPKSERRKWLEKHELATWPMLIHVTASRPFLGKYEVHASRTVVHSTIRVTPEKLLLRFDCRDIANMFPWRPVWPKSRFVKYEESDLEWALPLGFASLTEASQMFLGAVIVVSDYVAGFDCKAFIESTEANQRHGTIDVELVILSGAAC